MKARITHIQTANPPLKIEQKELLPFVMALDLPERRKDFYRRFLADDGIRTRTVAAEGVAQVLQESSNDSIIRFERTAVELAAQAGQKCLEASGLLPEKIDGLIVVTCTGYLCPGLTSYVTEALGLRPDIYMLDMVGHGCGAALPALRNADNFLAMHPKGSLLLVAVEICSAAFVNGDTVDQIVSNSIFGDGAAACILTNDARPGWALEQHASLLFPHYREELRFKTVDGRLTNILSKNVPRIVAEGVRDVLKVMKLERLPEIIACHTGGRAILDRLQVELNLAPHTLDVSRRVLAEYGNMSSPSVLYVLKQMMDNNIYDDGTPALMLSYGAGLTVNGAIVRWTI